MEKQLFLCRAEMTNTNHSIYKNEVVLGKGFVMAQCLSCGVMGIYQIADNDGAI